MSYSLNSKELKKLNNSIAAANKRTAENNFNDVTDISIVSWLANYDPSELPPELSNAFKLGPIQSSLGITQPIVWLANLSCNFTKAYNTVEDPNNILGPTLGGKRNAETGKRTYPRKFLNTEQLRFDKLQDEYHNLRWHNLLNLGYDPAAAAIKVGAIKDAEQDIFSPPPLFALSPRMIVTDENKRMSMKNVLITYLSKKAEDAERELLEDLEKESSNGSGGNNANGSKKGSKNARKKAKKKQKKQQAAAAAANLKSDKPSSVEDIPPILKPRSSTPTDQDRANITDLPVTVKKAALGELPKPTKTIDDAQKAANTKVPLNKEQLKYLREHERKTKEQNKGNAAKSYTEEDRKIIEEALIRNGLSKSENVTDPVFAEKVYKKASTLYSGIGTSGVKRPITTENNGIEGPADNGVPMDDECKGDNDDKAVCKSVDDDKKQEALQPGEKKPPGYQYAWCCDYCKTATFPTFAEAALHEAECPVYLAMEEKKIEDAAEEEWLKQNSENYEQTEEERKKVLEKIKNDDEKKRKKKMVEALINYDDYVDDDVLDDENKAIDDIICDDDLNLNEEEKSKEEETKPVAQTASISIDNDGGDDDDSSTDSTDDESEDDIVYEQFVNFEEKRENKISSVYSVPPPPPPPPDTLADDEGGGWTPVGGANKKKLSPTITTSNKKKGSKQVPTDTTNISKKGAVIDMPTGQSSKDKKKKPVKPTAVAVQDQPKNVPPKAKVEKNISTDDVQTKKPPAKPIDMNPPTNTKQKKKKKKKKKKQGNNSETATASGGGDIKSPVVEETTPSSTTISPTAIPSSSNISSSIPNKQSPTLMKPTTVIDYEDRVNDTFLEPHKVVPSPISPPPGINATVPEIPTEEKESTSLSQLTAQNSFLIDQNKSLLNQLEVLREKLNSSKQQSVEAIQRVQLKAYVAETARATAEEKATKLENLLVTVINDMGAGGVIRQEVQDSISTTSTVAHESLQRLNANQQQQHNFNRVNPSPSHSIQGLDIGQHRPRNEIRMPPWYQSNQQQHPPPNEQQMYHSQARLTQPRVNIGHQPFQDSGPSDFGDMSLGQPVVGSSSAGGESVLDRLRKGFHA